jgi:hypothetical protein
LKIGIILHCFREVGNLPVVKLKLKKWERVIAMAFPMNLTILVEMPCTSQLSFGARDLITFFNSGSQLSGLCSSNLLLPTFHH